MIASILLAIAACNRHQEQILWKGVTLAMPAKSETTLYYNAVVDPLDYPKESPKRFGEEKRQWYFPWMIEGVTVSPTLNKHSEFLVYSQEHHEVGDKAPMVMRMLLRLWDFSYKRMKFLQPKDYDNGRVTVYLCFGGRAGGEQLFDFDQGVEPISKKKLNTKVNTIYVYDVNSFTDPVEMAREIAHEYGHATLFHVDGFTAPEEYADGYLSEKFYLKWMRDALASGELTPDDVMGADKASLDKWLSTHVDPLIEKAAQIKPTTAAMSLKGVDGMNAYLGLALYIEALYPNKVFGRSLILTSSSDGKDYPHASDYPLAAILAAEEQEHVTLKIPPYLIGKPIWVPVGTGRLFGAKILKMDPSGWYQIIPSTGPVVVESKPL